MSINSSAINAAAINGSDTSVYYGTLAAALAITVASFGTLAAPLSIKTTATGTLAAPLSVIVTDPSVYATPAAQWGFVVRLDGIDISARVAGKISIDAEESSARLAQFSYFPSAPLNPSALVGKRVEIDYYGIASGAAQPPIRLFTGQVDIPSLTVTDGLIGIAATDNRQNEIKAAARDQLDALTTGSQWSPWVFADSLQGIDYADARLSTLNAALDKSATGIFRLTPWAAKSSPDFTYGAAAHIYGTPEVTLARRDRLVNTVNVGFDYRFPRLRLRQILYTWEALDDGYHLTGLPYAYFACLPSMGMIQDAGKATGWDIAYYEQTRIPITLGPGSVYTLEDLMTIRNFWMALSKRWGQSVTEKYAIQVTAANSVSSVGALAENEASSGQVEFDIDAWEKNASAPPVLALPPFTIFGDASEDVTAQVADGRSVADAAMQVLIARATTRIRASHRANTVSFDVPLDPRLDLIHTVQLENPRLSAKGKLGRLQHNLDLDAGSAISTLTLYLSGVAATGIASDPGNTPPAPPVPPPVPEVAYVVRLRTQTTFPPDYNLQGFIPCMLGITQQIQFKIDTPAISDAERQPMNTAPINQTYSFNVPVDTLTWTA